MIKNTKKHTYKAALLLLLTWGLFACGREQATGRFSGYVEAQLLYIAAPQSGWIVSPSLIGGEQVNNGELLFQLDEQQQLAVVSEAQFRLDQAIAQQRDTTTGAREEELAELEAQKHQARTALKLAKSERQRWTKLVAQGLAPPSRANEVDAQYDTSVAKLAAIEASIEVAKLGAREQLIKSADAARHAAQAVLTQARWQLTQRRVLAHASGQVEEVFYRQGEYVTQGKPVLALLPAHALTVRFFVPQGQLVNFALGDTVKVAADGLAQPQSARIFHIARSAEFTPPVIYDQQSRQKLLFMVEARLAANSTVRPGLPVDVSLP
jgi:HlyD family secretion protein